MPLTSRFAEPAKCPTHAFAPHAGTEDNVGVVDTTTSTFTTISIDTTGTYKYMGAAAVGTSVFLAPFNADTVGVVESFFA